MKILYIGDVMGRAGRETIKEVLPTLIKDKKIDFVIAQSENVSHGKGISPRHMRELQALGVDFFSGGNHSLAKPASHDLFDDANEPIIRPANMKKSLPGVGHKIAKTKKGNVLVISILGTTFPGTLEIDNPLKTIDKILGDYKNVETDAIVVNFHGDLSSQKRMIGHYLDGRVTAVIGDHWHVATADASILPGGTAHISDVGMVGSIHSSLGIAFEDTIPAWKNDTKRGQKMDLDKPYQFNAVIFDVEMGRSTQIEQIQIKLN